MAIMVGLELIINKSATAFEPSEFVATEGIASMASKPFG